MEETITKENSSSEDADTNSKYEDIIKRENELHKQITENKSDINTSAENTSKIPIRSWISELKKGEVIDMEYNSESNLILEVKLDKNNTTKVIVKDSGDHSEDNELSRLLVSKNIKNGRISDLIGKNITLVSKSFFKHRVCYEDTEWAVYIPSSLDVFGKIYFRIDNILRLIGVGGFQQYLDRSDNIIESVIMLFLMLALLTNFYALLIITVSGLLFIGTPMTELILLSLLLTISTSLFYKIYSEIKHKYTSYRSKDSLN